MLVTMPLDLYGADRIRGWRWPPEASPLSSVVGFSALIGDPSMTALSIVWGCSGVSGLGAVD